MFDRSSSGVVMLSALPVGRWNEERFPLGPKEQAWVTGLLQTVSGRLTARDSRQSSRMKDYSCSLTSSVTHRHWRKDRERLPPSLHYLMWARKTVGTFLIPRQCSATKRGNFHQPDFEQQVQQPIGNLEKTRGGGVCGLEQGRAIFDYI